MSPTIRAVLSEAYPPKPTFKVEDIPDLTGKVMIVTGANTGASIALNQAL